MPDVGCQHGKIVQTGSRCDQDICQARIEASADRGIFQSSSFPRDGRVDRDDALVEINDQAFEPKAEAFCFCDPARPHQFRNASFHFQNYD